MRAQCPTSGRIQILIDCDATVEDEAFAFKAAVWKLLEVVQDTPFELIHIFVALLLHLDDGFFATDSSGAVHQDFLILREIHVPNGGRKVREIFGLGINGALKHPELRLVHVSNVDENQIILRVENLLPLFRRKMVLRVRCVDRGFCGDDLLSHLHPEVLERLLDCVGSLERPIGVAEEDRKRLLEESYCFESSGDCPVATLLGEDDEAALYRDWETDGLS